jgi:hypothetical protein
MNTNPVTDSPTIRRTLQNLIDAIYQHHATSRCNSNPLFVAARDALAVLGSTLQPEALTELEETRRGIVLADVLRLRAKRDNGRYDLEGGDKTALGLYRTVKRIIEEGE